MIAWFTHNPVAANLLMLMVIVAGIFGLTWIRTETFPQITPDVIEITVPYPGATPTEVEEGIIAKIEESLRGISGIRDVRSTARESSGTVRVRTRDLEDMAALTDEIKLAVDTISTFPQEAERPIIKAPRWTRGAINLQISGADNEKTLTEITRQLQRELLTLEDISLTELWGARDYEISIEVDELALRRYGLTLQEIAARIRASSLNLPGGNIRTEGGNIQLRTQGQAYIQRDFEQLVVLRQPDGTRLHLGDVALVNDGFTDTRFHAFFNGQRSLGISVLAVERQNELDVARAVKDWVKTRRATLPPGIQLDIWADHTVYLQERMSMMLENLVLGAVLVFLVLGAFLAPSVAFWVIAGLPVAFLGALALMPLGYIDVSINMLSLFAFILVLGIVVDDAIIIGESAWAAIEENGHSAASVIEGAQAIAMPATFGVLTTVAAFMPLLFITGVASVLAVSIGAVVILCLLFSLVESKLILPAHMAHFRMDPSRRPKWSRWGEALLDGLRTRWYGPLLNLALRQRYASVAVFLGLLLISSALIYGGQVRYVFFPEIDEDYIRARIELTESAPEALLFRIVADVDQALDDVNQQLTERYGAPVIKNSFAYIFGGRVGSFQVELDRSMSGIVPVTEVSRLWREAVGEVAGVEKLSIRATRDSGGGPPIAYKLLGRDPEQLIAASTYLSDELRKIDGLYEVENDSQGSRQEARITLNAHADNVGLSLLDVATQVRHAVYGAEAQRIQRGDDELKVMVRYPEHQRRSLGAIEDMWLMTPAGIEVPFSSVASFDMAPGYTRIQRIDGARSVSVTARADSEIVEPRQIESWMEAQESGAFRSLFPGIEFRADGSLQEEQAAVIEMVTGFTLALMAIYALIAIPLKSYIQPIIVMGVIPFGFVGATVGHWLLGYSLSVISILGIVALAGIVVNDSLILVDAINRRSRQGMDLLEAAEQAGHARLRAIVLTSVTTFFGLIPMLLETSMQAQIMVPMAVSVAFGILFATIITLLLVPCLIVITDDCQRALSKLFSRSPASVTDLTNT